MIKKIQNSSNKFIEISILFFCLFPLIPNKIKGVTVILLFLICLQKFKFNKIDWKSFFVNSSVYLLFIVSNFFFLEANNESKQILETTLSILVIPLVFFVLIPKVSFKDEFKLKFMKLFLLFTTLYALLVTLFIFFDNDTLYYSNWYSNKARTIVEKIPYIGQHPIYASIFSAISCLFFIELLRNNYKQKRWELSIYIFCFFTNLFFLIQLSSRGVIIALLICIFLHFFFKVKNNRNKIWLLIAITAIIVLLFRYNRRMNELIKFETYTEVNSNYSNSYRILIYNCSFSVMKSNFLLGYGVGNVQNELNKCFIENNESFMVNKYNSHNQYIDILLKVGLLGLSFFMLFLGSNYLIAFKNNNHLFLLILIFYSIVFLVENVLVRQSGVILFYFLVTFFNRLSKSNSIIENV